MANMIITFKIMPESPDVDLSKIEEKANEFIVKYGGEVGRKTIVPIAFGLKAVELIFVADESKGSTDELEKNISGIEGVQSVEITDMRRALG